MMTFGENGSGKTYTMLGDSTENDDDYDDDGRSGVSSMGSGGVSRQPNDQASITDMSLQPPQQIVAVAHDQSFSSNVLKQKEQKRNGEDFDENCGLIPRTGREIYSIFRKRRKRGDTANDDPDLRLSYVEVYNEKIIDLLNRRNSADDDAESLQVRSDPDEGIFIEGAKEVLCRSQEDFINAIEKGQTIRRERTLALGKSESKHELFVSLFLPFSHFFCQI